MPTRDTAWPAGTPCWVDYSATDAEAARAFYTDVLGWTYTEGVPEYGGYATCLSGGRAAAGMMPKMAPEQPSAWQTYFATSDAQATAARVTGAGGSVVAPPMTVGPLGTMLVATDSQGAFFGAWQAGEHTGVEVYNEPGALVWNEAAFEDPEAARAFYTAVFGFTFSEVPESGGYTTFSTGEGPLGGLGGTSPSGQPGWTTCFSVSSVDDAVASVEGGGGAVTMAAQDTSFGRFAVVQDPWGATFSLMQELPS